MNDALEIKVAEEIHHAESMGGDGITRYRSPDGSLYSLYPPTAFLTFANWIYMVPPFKPENVLLLGYGGGTVAGLIRLLYGEVEITGVDLAFVDNRYGVRQVQADANTWVRDCGNFDCVIVDVFNGQLTASFVCEYEFVTQIARITRRCAIVHCDPSQNIGVYEQFFQRLQLMQIRGHNICYFKKFDDTTQYFPDA